MKVIIEDEDYIKAITPFYNGCKFIPIFKQDGSVWLDCGCYLLVNLVTGAKKYLYEKWLENNKQPFKIEVSPETKLKMMAEKPCKHCGGAKFERYYKPM